MNNVAPCKDCKERELHCHSRCKKYIEYKKYREEMNEKERVDRQITGSLKSSIYPQYY